MPIFDENHREKLDSMMVMLPGEFITESTFPLAKALVAAGGEVLRVDLIDEQGAVAGAGSRD